MLPESVMRQICLSISLILFFVTGYPQPAGKTEIVKKGTAATAHLPLIMIDTNGQTIFNEPKITVNIKVIDNGPGKSNSTTDPGNQYDGLAGIEIRGQSSQMFPKKSYSVELRNTAGEDVKAGLMGMPEESDWVLYAPYSDKTMLRNALTYYLGRKMGRWQPGFRFCEVYLNGLYIGVYQLTEKIKRDKERVDIAKLQVTDISGDALTGGYIIKVDKVDGSDYFTNYPDVRFEGARNYRWTWYHPKSEDLANAQRNYFMSYIKTVENTINGKDFADPDRGYARYLDVPSFIDFQIMNEFSNNVDGYRYSTYFHKQKDSDGGKLKAGPLWDFDLCYGNVDYSPQNLATDQWTYTFWGPNEYNCMHWWYRFMQDPNYQRDVWSRWTDLRKGAFATDSIMGYIDAQVNWLGDAVYRNFVQWPVLGSYVWPNSAVRYSYPMEISFLKNWILQRLAWMDANWLRNPAVEDTIPDFDNISLYPNPVADWLTIDLPSSERYYTIQLSDIRGAVIFSETVKETRPASYKLNFSGLKNGIYLVSIRRPGIPPLVTKAIKRS
jgi:hypothetical protein